MKIRIGFVSNSSSTSYVIALTRDFIPSDKDLEEFIDETKDYSTDKKMSVEEAKKHIKDLVETLCVNGDWSAYDGDWSNGEHYPEHLSTFLHSFEDDILISEADGGHGCDFLHNILADDLKDKTIKLADNCRVREWKKDIDKKNENS